MNGLGMNGKNSPRSKISLGMAPPSSRAATTDVMRRCRYCSTYPSLSAGRWRSAIRNSAGRWMTIAEADRCRPRHGDASSCSSRATGRRDTRSSRWISSAQRYGIATPWRGVATFARGFRTMASRVWRSTRSQDDMISQPTGPWREVQISDFRVRAGGAASSARAGGDVRCCLLQLRSRPSQFHRAK